MNGAHWTEQDLINHLYGIGPAEDHLDECGGCRERWIRLSARREEVLRSPEVSGEFLAAQRRSIYRRLGRGPANNWRMAPAFAIVLLVLLGFLVFRPASTPPGTQVISNADSQLLAEISALEEAWQPEAVRTVQELFEEN